MTSYLSEFHRLIVEDPESFHEQFYALVLTKCRQVATRYPVGRYNGNLPWDDSSIADLAQDVYVDNLLSARDRQLDYIMSSARSTAAIEALLVVQIKRVLRVRAGKDPVDRLIKRVRDLGDEGYLTVGQAGGGRVYSMPDSVLQADRAPSEREILKAADCARAVPVIWSRLGAERETMVYSKDNLKLVLGLILSQLSPIEERDLRRVFDALLTPLLPASLLSIEEKTVDLKEPDNAKVLIDFEPAIRDFVNGLGLLPLKVMIFKSQGISDEEVGRLIGRSRPTVAKLKDEFEAKLRSAFNQVGDFDEVSVVMERLIELAHYRYLEIEESV